MEAMQLNIWEPRPGERITLDSGSVAEVVAPTEDGSWIRVKYVHAPDLPDLVGTEDLCATEEIVYRAG